MCPDKTESLRCASRVSWEMRSTFCLTAMQDDIIGVARFIYARLERVYTSTGPPVGDQASDQP